MVPSNIGQRQLKHTHTQVLERWFPVILQILRSSDFQQNPLTTRKKKRGGGEQELIGGLENFAAEELCEADASEATASSQLPACDKQFQSFGSNMSCRHYGGKPFFFSLKKCPGHKTAVYHQYKRLAKAHFISKIMGGGASPGPLPSLEFFSKKWFKATNIPAGYHQSTKQCKPWYQVASILWWRAAVAANHTAADQTSETTG